MPDQDIYDNPQFQGYLLERLDVQNNKNRLADICWSSSTHKKTALRLRGCGRRLWVFMKNGKLQIINASHCNVRSCPECQKIRQGKLTNKFKRWIKPFLLQHHDLKFVFLSIGFENVVVNEISDTNDLIHEWHGQIFRRPNKKLPTKGHVTFFHFTISPLGTIHFNNHSILAIDATKVGSNNWLNESYLAQLISKKFTIYNSKSIDIQEIRSGDVNVLQDELETRFGYSAQPQNYLPDIEMDIDRPELITLGLIDGLAGSRSIVTGGEFLTFPRRFPEIPREKRQPNYEIFCGDKLIIRKYSDNERSLIYTYPTLYL